jgi:hypothetical protein
LPKPLAVANWEEIGYGIPGAARIHGGTVISDLLDRFRHWQRWATVIERPALCYAKRVWFLAKKGKDSSLRRASGRQFNSLPLLRLLFLALL